MATKRELKAEIVVLRKRVDELAAREAGRDARANEIRLGLIELLYRLERALKGAR
jgi:hypothetical protein